MGKFSRNIIFIILSIVFLIPSNIFAGGFYKWVDENGTIHFSDSTSGIPKKYRQDVAQETFKKIEKPKSGSEIEIKEGDPALETLSSLTDQGNPLEPKKYEVPYQAFEGNAKRIIIPVTFNGSVTAPMALDTGAPGLVISPRLAQKLDLLDTEETNLMVSAGGVGGSVPAVRTIMDSVQVGGAKDTFIPTTVIPSISGAFEGLVGMDFMSNYSISIDPLNNVLVLQEIPPGANSPGGHDETWWKSNFNSFGALRDIWQQYKEKLDSEIRDSLGPSDRTKKLRNFATNQFKAADQLFEKLNRYAIQHAVPMSWRKY